MGTVARALSAIVVLFPLSCAGPLEESKAEDLKGSRRPLQVAGTVFIRRDSGRSPVEVSEEQYREAMRRLLRDVHTLQRTGALTPPFRVVPVVGEPFDPLQLALASDYLAWCGRRHQHGDCLELLKDRPYLDREALHKIAFDIALGSQWDGFTEELRSMADPAAVRVVLLGAIVGYMALLAFPGVVTQGIAAVAAVALTAWLGVDTVWNLISGWIRMRQEVDAATTFGQLRAAGERYGKTIGANTARVLVMVVTAAISEGGLVAKLLNLPGAARASVALAANSGGMELVAAGQVSEATVAASGITVVLAPATRGAQVGAVVMAAANPGGGASSGKAKPAVPKKGPGGWGKAKSPARGRAGVYQQQITHHPPEEVYFVNGVEFDGYEAGEDVLLHTEDGEGVLLDAKGQGYKQFFKKDLKPYGWFKGRKQLIDQGKRQLKAIQGMRIKIRWHVAEEKAAKAIRLLLDNNECEAIEVVYTPPTPSP